MPLQRTPLDFEGLEPKGVQESEHNLALSSSSGAFAHHKAAAGSQVLELNRYLHANLELEAALELKHQW